MRRLWPLLLLFSCSVTPLGDGPRKAAVRNLVEQVILPTLDDFAARADELTLALYALELAPDEQKLADAQARWRAARVPWKEQEAFGFGPAKDLHLDAAIDQWPPDPVELDAILAGTDELTDSYVALLGANKKGFHGIEHVLFGPAPLDARRLRYASAAGLALRTDAARLRDAWTAYGVRFVEAGDADSVHATIKAVIDTLVNESLAMSERVADTRLGVPMGKPTGGEPHPELAESPLSENSVADMAASLRGVRNLYRGTRDGSAGLGLEQLVADASPVIARSFREDLEAALAAVGALPPLGDAVLAADPRLETAYLAVKEVKRALAADVTAALGATLKFNDNDGD